MEPWLQALVTAAGAVLASGGFWAWLQAKDKNKHARDKLLLVLMYDKIVDRGMMYIDRGWITREEFEDFCNLYYEPYKTLGGNGVAEKIFREVTALTMRSFPKYAEIDQKSSVKVEFQNGR